MKENEERQVQISATHASKAYEGRVVKHARETAHDRYIHLMIRL